MKFDLTRKILNVYLSLLLPLSFILSYNNNTVLISNTKETFYLISIIFIFILISFILIGKLRSFPLDIFCFFYVVLSCMVYLIVEDQLKGKSLLIVILSIFLSTLILSKYLNNYKFEKSSHIILLFLICCHFVSIFNFFIFSNNGENLSENKNINKFENKNFFEQNDLKLNINEKTIFFYIIMDGFPSIKELDSVGFKTDKLVEILDKHDFYIIKDTFSDYVRSERSISSTLNFGKIKEPNNFSKRDYYYHIPNSKFVNLFKNAGAEIVWFPNELYMSHCPKNFKVTCVRDKFNFKIFENEITINYLKYFLINAYYPRNVTGKILGKFNYFKSNLNFNIDLITDYVRENEINKPHLFYAHFLSPHPPYRVNSKCNIQYKKDLNEQQLFLEQTQCNINQIRKFLKIIDEKIPNSYIFLHSDHGTPLYSQKDHDPMNFVSISKNLVCENKNILDYSSNIEIFKKILNCVN